MMIAALFAYHPRPACTFVFLGFLAVLIPHPLFSQPMPTPETTTFISRSQEFLRAARTGAVDAELVDSIAQAAPDALAAELSDDNARKAFWINLYNGYIQLFLRQDSLQYQDKGSFFKTRRIPVAQTLLSFDDIEHGILRRSRIKLSLGYLGKLFVGKFERQFRVEQQDARIHFALNCGAQSCPAIASFDREGIDTLLDLNARAYLEGNTRITSDAVYVTRLFLWFRGDFGGKRGIRHFLQQYKILPEDSKHTLRYLPYSWQLDLDNFSSQH